MADRRHPHDVRRGYGGPGGYDRRRQDDRRDGYDNRGPPGVNTSGGLGGPGGDRRYDQQYDNQGQGQGGYRGPNDRGPPTGGRGGGGWGNRGQQGGFDPNAGNPAVHNRPSMMHGGGYNNRPSMMHGGGGGGGFNKASRPSLLASSGRQQGGRPEFQDATFDEGEVGEIGGYGAEDRSREAADDRSREPWDTSNERGPNANAERGSSGRGGWGQRLESSSRVGIANLEEDGELPTRGGRSEADGGAPRVRARPVDPPLPRGAPPESARRDASVGKKSRDVLNFVATEPTPIAKPLARHLSAPVAPDVTDKEERDTEKQDVAPKRKKLGWGQGLNRSKSTGAALETGSPAYPERLPSVPLPVGDDRKGHDRHDTRTPPLLTANNANPFGDDPEVSREAPSTGFGGASTQSHRDHHLAPEPSPRSRGPSDPVARAALVAVSKASVAARREMLVFSEKQKETILRAMELTDSSIVSLEREIAAMDDTTENDREQVEEQRTHQEARLRRELEGVKGNVERAEKASRRAEFLAAETAAEAEELRRKAGLIDAETREKEKKDGAKSLMKSSKEKELVAAKASARAVQRMLAGREPRVVLVERVRARNEQLATKSHLALKLDKGFPLPHEVVKVSVAETARKNWETESNDAYRASVRVAVTQVLRERREATRDKALNLAVTYMKRREQWRLHMKRVDLATYEKEMGVKPGGKIPAPGLNRGSSRGALPGLGGSRGSFGGAARSEYEELQMIHELQQRERLKTLVKLPSQILDLEEKRVAAFTRNVNALVEDPKAEAELAKLTRPWLEWEKKIFHEKFASYGKNFKRIATFIDGRVTSDCVVYYYQKQKTEDGFKGRRRAQAKKRKAYAEAKRMTGGTWSGPGGGSVMSAAALAKLSREREQELRGAEEERKNRSAEARLERAAAAAGEKKKAKEKAAREKKKREKAEAKAAEALAREAEKAAAETKSEEKSVKKEKGVKRKVGGAKAKSGKDKPGVDEYDDGEVEEKNASVSVAADAAVAAAAAYQQAAAAAAAVAAANPAIAAAMRDPPIAAEAAVRMATASDLATVAIAARMTAGGQAAQMAALAAAGGAPPLVGADAPAPAVPTGTKRKAEDPPAVEPKQKGKGKKAAKTAKLPDDASLKWGQGVEEK